MFYNNVITKKNAFGDQNLLIFPPKNACGWKDREYHGDRYTHTSNLWVSLLRLCSLQNEQFLYFLTTVQLIIIKLTMNEAFSTQRFCEWRCLENRWEIVFTLSFLLENLSWAYYFASVYAAMSLLRLFQVQGINPKCESVKTRDYMLMTYKI